MTTELVRLTDGNPLKELRRSDGTWSAREVQASGHVHSVWRDWEAAIQRGAELLNSFNIAGQRNFEPSLKISEPGKRGPKTHDYDLDALWLFASCQQSRLPELDLWFVFAGLQAAGYGKQPVRQVVPNFTSSQLGTFTRQIAGLDPKVQMHLVKLATQRPPEPLPPTVSYQVPPTLALPSVPSYHKVPGSPSLYTGTKGQDSNDQHQ